MKTVLTPSESNCLHKNHLRQFSKNCITIHARPHWKLERTPLFWRIVLICNIFQKSSHKSPADCVRSNPSLQNHEDGLKLFA